MKARAIWHILSNWSRHTFYSHFTSAHNYSFGFLFPWTPPGRLFIIYKRRTSNWPNIKLLKSISSLINVNAINFFPFGSLFSVNLIGVRALCALDRHWLWFFNLPLNFWLGNWLNWSVASAIDGAGRLAIVHVLHQPPGVSLRSAGGERREDKTKC